MKESTVQRNIINALRARGAYVLNPYSAEEGTPDLIVCYEGRFFALEVKTDTGRASKIQLHRLAQVESAGGVARIVRSVADAVDAVNDCGDA